MRTSKKAEATLLSTPKPKQNTKTAQLVIAAYYNSMKKNKRPPQTPQKAKTKQPIWKQSGNHYNLVGWLNEGDRYKVLAGNQNMLHIKLVNPIAWADPTNLWIDRFVENSDNEPDADEVEKTVITPAPVCAKTQGVCFLKDKDSRACLFCSV